MATASLYCEECDKVSQAVFDYAGDVAHTACSECGIILESKQTLVDNSDDNGNLSPLHRTVPFEEPSVPPEDHELEELISGFRRISNMSDKLGLDGTLKDRSSEIFTIFNQGRVKRGTTPQGRREAILASCVHVACRQAGKRLSGKEICSVANHGITVIELRRATEAVDKKLKRHNG